MDLASHKKLHWSFWLVVEHDYNGCDASQIPSVRTETCTETWRYRFKIT